MHVEKFFDPHSIRDASISQPFPGGTTLSADLSGSGAGWVVCLKSNAKNRFGDYTGLSDTAYVIRDGRVIDTLAENGWMLCKSAKQYEPFKI
jgi:hypothetical protein